MKDDTLGVYLSIPFCKAKCSFCNFASGVFAVGTMQAYVDRLCAELQQAKSFSASLGAALPNQVDTIYFGGGTPSLLEPSHLEQIFHALRGEFAVAADAEITLEAAPGQIADATLAAAMRLGVNRVSFGVQSFVDPESAAVGRTHTRAECRAEIARMHAEGINRVGVDLIVGLPYQTEQSWAYSIQQAIESGADHVSVYLLEVDEDSRLGREALAGGQRYHARALPSEDAMADWYQAACECLAAAGIEQYEISNFARPGFASRHNLKYWHRRPYLGVGLDAHSMLLCPPEGESVAVRWANGNEMDEYLADGAVSLRILPEVERSKRTVDCIGIEQAFEEAMFLGLRLNQGIDLARLRADYGASRLDAALHAMEDVQQAGLIAHTGYTIQLTPAGRLASNEVFSRLLAA